MMLTGRELVFRQTPSFVNAIRERVSRIVKGESLVFNNNSIVAETRRNLVTMHRQ